MNFLEPQRLWLLLVVAAVLAAVRVTRAPVAIGVVRRGGADAVAVAQCAAVAAGF